MFFNNLPSPTKMFQHAIQAAGYALSWDGVEYGLSKALLDTGLGIAEGLIAPAVAGLTGPTIAVIGLRTINAASTFGLQLSFQGDGGRNSNGPVGVPTGWAPVSGTPVNPLAMGVARGSLYT